MSVLESLRGEFPAIRTKLLGLVRAAIGRGHAGPARAAARRLARLALALDE